jgi:hypothetical protein
MHIPGFTAESTLSRAGRRYRAVATTSTILGSNALTPALKNTEPTWIDCNDFPNNITCRECGITGPGSVVCCPDDYCAVIDRSRISETVRGLRAGMGNWSFQRN